MCQHITSWEGFFGGAEDMRRIVVIAILALLSTECLAQGGPTSGQCNQVRAAVAQHGLQAARKHAAENYGLTPADLRTIEQDCGIAQNVRANRPRRAARSRDDSYR